MDKRRVLIVDDEKEFCNLIKDSLELRGTYDVEAAYNGKDGFRLAKRTKPDLILLDIRMPEMDGFEVLERLKKDLDTMEIPVVMLSALDDDKSKTKSARLYNESYLTKPIKIAELQSKIEEVFARKKQP